MSANKSDYDLRPPQFYTTTVHLDAGIAVQDMNGGNMLAALRAHNWVSFATQYNGVNENAQNQYNDKLAAAYASLAG